MTDKSQTQYAVTMELAEHLLRGDGRYLTTGNANSASRKEIETAFEQATRLVNDIVRGK